MMSMLDLANGFTIKKHIFLGISFLIFVAFCFFSLFAGFMFIFTLFGVLISEIGAHLLSNRELAASNLFDQVVEV